MTNEKITKFIEEQTNGYATATNFIETENFINFDIVPTKEHKNFFPSTTIVAIFNIRKINKQYYPCGTSYSETLGLYIDCIFDKIKGDE